MLRGAFRLVAAAFFFGWAATGAHAETVSVAAAADLVFCLEEMQTAFEKANPGAALEVTVGASGALFSQIERGGPFDLFLSADVQYPRRLVASGLGKADDLVIYAHGRLALWTRRSDLPLDRGLALLMDSSIKKVAIANPEHAPYGRAARSALEHEKLWSLLQPKLVFGESAGQALQFVESGNADAGLVPLSLLLGPRLAAVGSHFIIPDAITGKIDQAALLTSQGAVKLGARAFWKFLRASEGRRILEHYGFTLPPAGGAAPGASPL